MKSFNTISSWIKRNQVICLFIILFIVFNLNLRTINSGDTIPASLLPFNILENHNVYFDDYKHYYESFGGKTYYFYDTGEHIVSNYPIVLPVLITPLYVVPYAILKLIQCPIDIYNPGFQLSVMYMEMLSASIIASISSIFIFLSLRELINSRVAIFGSLVYAFATNTWTISSQALWQQGMVELLLSIMIFLVIINEKRDDCKNIIYLGILSGLFVFNRPSDSLLLLPIAFYVLAYKTKKIHYYVLPMAVTGLPFLVYNLCYFGSVFGGYNSLLSWFSVGHETLVKFSGMLISPGRGLFIFTPIILTGIIGLFRVDKIKNPRIQNFLYVSLVSIFLLTLMYSTFDCWWAGWSYGPRFLTGALPVLIIFIGLSIPISIGSGNPTKKELGYYTVFAVLLILSVFVQITGSFYYPNGNWDGDTSPIIGKKLWDWQDNQITRSFNAGAFGPQNPLWNAGVVLESKRFSILDADANVSIKYGNGWYGIETSNDKGLQWMSDNSTLLVTTKERGKYDVSTEALSHYRPRTMNILVNGELIGEHRVGNGFVSINSTVELKKGMNEIMFTSPEGSQRPCDIPELNCGGDMRNLSFMFRSINIHKAD